MKKICEKCGKVKVEQKASKKHWINGKDVCERCFYHIKASRGHKIREHQGSNSIFNIYSKWVGET